jgi:putative pyruvate formate lyase activating enzyme
MEIGEVIRRITEILNTGIEIVGFVSPTHFVPQVKVIVEILRNLGYNPRFVYNTNAYDLPETLQELETYIDIYLPDFKYSVAELGRKYSDARDYPTIALNALKEMVRQKGLDLEVGPDGYARKGVIVRHLVLPGHPRNSIGVLRTIADEVSNELHISLMSQYYPTYRVKDHETLGRTLRAREYEMVVGELETLGFQNGWVQELESSLNYRPDFREDHPFES